MSESQLSPWRIRLAAWLLRREANRQWKRDGKDTCIVVSSSITKKPAGKPMTASEFRRNYEWKYTVGCGG